MTQSLRVRRFLALILVVAVAVIAVTGCAKRSAVSPEPGVQTSNGVLKGLPAGTSDTSSPALAPTAPVAQQAAIDRKIIFNASLSLDVVDAEKAFSDCEILVAKYGGFVAPVSYTHLRAHETRHDLVCRLLLEKKKKKNKKEPS